MVEILPTNVLMPTHIGEIICLLILYQGDLKGNYILFGRRCTREPLKKSHLGDGLCFDAIQPYI